MRFHLDCALLAVNPDWAQHLVSSVAPCERLRLQIVPLPDMKLADSYLYLRQQVSLLQRYDACLLPISTANLVWVRRALSASQGHASVPILGLTHELKAAALADLYGLGLADYVRAPLCLEDLRARIHKIRSSVSRAALETVPTHLQYSVSNSSVAHIPNTVSAGDSTVLHDSGCEHASLSALALRYTLGQSSFKEAKGRVVASFEYAYICAVLDKHQGNIAQSARFAQKHRRAFWGLMRKHQIDADRFRRIWSASAKPLAVVKL